MAFTSPLPRQNGQRGALLLEAALAVGIATSLFALTISINNEQQRRADATILAGEKRIIMDAARGFVADNRIDLIETLFDDARTNGADGRHVVTIGDLTAAGYLSPVFNPGASLERITGQEYALLLRPVFQGDTNNPAVSLREVDMDPLGLGMIDPRFLDGDPTNDEIGIEAVLFSFGGTALPPGQAGRVVEAVERINAGFIAAGTRARGAGGTMNFDITGFSAFDGFGDTGVGRFASPVSLASLGAIGDSGSSAPIDLRETFLRCVDLNPIGTSFADCISAPRNEIFGNIVLRPHDSNEDGTVDAFPAILGATRILCADAIGDETDPVDETAFLIDCQTTRVNGVLDVTGDEIRFAGETLVELRDIDGVDQVTVAADRFAMRLPSGTERDLAETVMDAFTLSARDTVAVHECPSMALDGSALVPRATASVAVALDPWGRAMSGAVALVERGNGAGGDDWTPSPTGTRWMARVLYTLNAGYCDADFSDPIDIRSTFSNPADPGAPSAFFPDTLRPANGRCGDLVNPNPNGPLLADIYEMYPVGASNFGGATITLSCAPPS